MKLGIEDRIIIYGLFPPEGEYELLKAFREMEPLIKFSEEETRNYDIKQVAIEGGNNQITYNKEVADENTDGKEVKIPHRALSYCIDRLEKMSNDNKLTYQLMPIYEKLVLGKVKNVRNTNKSSKSDNGK